MPTTYYLNADTGNDSTGDGSSGLPWLTIAKAHDSATGGDTIICQDSTATYTWAAQTFSKILTIQGQQDDASGAVFDAAGGPIRWDIDVDITVEKITFHDNRTVTLGNGKSIFNRGAELTMTFTNCKFLSIDLGSHIDQSNGILGGGDTTTPTYILTKCLFSGGNHAVTSPVSFNIIGERDCKTLNLTMTNCTVYNSVSLTSVIGSPQTLAGVITIEDCIFYNSGASAPFVFYGNANSATKTYNYNDGYNIVELDSGTGNITDDPLFVDVDNENFNLRPVPSPAIGTGS